jgi:hypothetical protein
MKIHIRCTEEYSVEKLHTIKNILSTTQGEIAIGEATRLNNNYIASINTKFTRPDSYFSLSFDELFSICDFHRLTSNQINPEEISADDYLVLITSISNDRNWFSAIDENKNIFIHSKSFEYNTDRDEEYGIAYNILVNVFQSLLGLTYSTLPDNTIVHKKSIGCINDYCRVKRDIILKLRTGYICDNCLNEAIKSNVSPQLLLHIHELLQDIRGNFMNLNMIKDKLKPSDISINQYGDIFIGEQKLELAPLEKTLMYYYLTLQNGIVTRFLDDDKVANELFAIYKTFRRSGQIESIKGICESPGTNDSNYSRIKNSLNNKIKRKLGIRLSGFYEINPVKIENEIICLINKDGYQVLINEDFKQNLISNRERIKSHPIRLHT